MRKYALEMSLSALADAESFVARLRWYYAAFFRDTGLDDESAIVDRYVADSNALVGEILAEIERCVAIWVVGNVVTVEKGRTRTRLVTFVRSFVVVANVELYDDDGTAFVHRLEIRWR